MIRILSQSVGLTWNMKAKAGYTCEPEYSKEDLAQILIFNFNFCRSVVDLFTLFFFRYSHKDLNLKILDVSSPLNNIFFR